MIVWSCGPGVLECGGASVGRRSAGEKVTVAAGRNGSVKTIGSVSSGVSETGAAVAGICAVGVGYAPHSEESVAQAVKVSAMMMENSCFMLFGIIPAWIAGGAQFIRWG
jgi:hypothetical protein